MTEILSPIEERLDDPTAKGLAHAVSRAIRDGVLAPGTKLPPIREVARELALSPTTVSAGWALLARSGTIQTDGRRGTTVANTAVPVAGHYQTALEHQVPFVLDLSTGIPDNALLPSLERAIEGLTTAGTPSYLDAPVLPELAAVLREDWPYPTENLAVVDGAMDALDMVTRATLRFGDRVIVENPCFPPLINLLTAIGVQVVGIPLDEEGVQPASLEEALATPAAAVFLQPRAQNPTGVSLSARRARGVAKLLKGTSTLVVEDDSAGSISPAELISVGRWLPDQTVHIRSFSKAYGPDLRLAALSGPAELLNVLAGRRQLGQGWSSRLLQRILLNLLTDPETAREIVAARNEYGRRRAAVVDELARHEVVVGGTDGINIWVPVHDESAAIIRLASHGIGVTPGTPFAVLPQAAPHIRVTVGLVREDHTTLAATLAAAAKTTHWYARGR